MNPIVTGSPENLKGKDVVSVVKLAAEKVVQGTSETR